MEAAKGEVVRLNRALSEIKSEVKEASDFSVATAVLKLRAEFDAKLEPLQGLRDQVSALSVDRKQDRPTRSTVDSKASGSPRTKLPANDWNVDAPAAAGMPPPVYPKKRSAALDADPSQPDATPRRPRDVTSGRTRSTTDPASPATPRSPYRRDPVGNDGPKPRPAKQSWTKADAPEAAPIADESVNVGLDNVMEAQPARYAPALPSSVDAEEPTLGQSTLDAPSVEDSPLGTAALDYKDPVLGARGEEEEDNPADSFARKPPPPLPLGDGEDSLVEPIAVDTANQAIDEADSEIVVQPPKTIPRKNFRGATEQQEIV